MIMPGCVGRSSRPFKNPRQLVCEGRKASHVHGGWWLANRRGIPLRSFTFLVVVLQVHLEDHPEVLELSERPGLGAAVPALPQLGAVGADTKERQ